MPPLKQEEVAASFASSRLGPEAGHFGANDLGGWETFGPALAVTLVATITVGLRRYTRSWIARCPGWDDAAVEWSLLSSWAMAILLGVAAHDGLDLQRHYGVGGTTDESHDHELAKVVKLVIANNSLWAATVNLTKVSILLQYLRVFASGHAVRHATYVLLTTVLLAALWAIVGGPLICTPVKKLWIPTTPGTCVSAQTYWSSVASLDIILDFLILLLPLPAVSSLRLPRRQRTTMLLVFLLGFVVCGFSTARLVTVLALADQGKFRASGFWAVVWSVVEANVGIVCSCLLALRPLLLRWFPSLDDASGRDATSADMRLNAVPDQSMAETAEASTILQVYRTPAPPVTSELSSPSSAAEAGVEVMTHTTRGVSDADVATYTPIGQERRW